MDDRYTTRPPHGGSRRRRRQRARRRLLPLVVVLAAAAVTAAVAMASCGGSGKAGGTASSAGASRSATPSPPPTTPPPAIWVATKQDPVRVWVGGDSMGGELGYGLGPILEKSKVFKPFLYYKESTGICRWDFFDWGSKMDTVMRTVKPDAVVIMMGTNDTQSLWDNGTWTLYSKPAWQKKYAVRVGDMMDMMLDHSARRVYWVGMPIMGESWRNAVMKRINKAIAAEAATHPGAEYIDTWPLFTTASGAYMPQWRGPDGVHFTVAGQQRLAKAVYGVIKKEWAPYGLPSATPTPQASPSASASAGATP